MQHWLGQVHLSKRIQSHIVSMFRHAVSVWKIKKVQRWLIRDKEKGVHRSDFNTLENLICEMIEWIFHL